VPREAPRAASESTAARVSPSLPQGSPAEKGRRAFALGDFEEAAKWLQTAYRQSPDDLELAYDLARALAAADDPERAILLLGDLLSHHPGLFNRRAASEPSFVDPHYVALVETGGATPWPDPYASATFDVDSNGVPERFIISSRGLEEKRFLSMILDTPQGKRAITLLDEPWPDTVLHVLPISGHWFLVFLEHPGGHSADAAILLVNWQSLLDAKVRYQKRFIQDAGDADEPPPADGAMWLTVLNLDSSPEPELVLTFLDPFGEPSHTNVLKLDGGVVTELGPAQALRQQATTNLQKDAHYSASVVAEARVRLDPESIPARLDLLRAAASSPTDVGAYWGLHPVGSNDHTALHAAFVARHAPSRRTALARVPIVAAFLRHWRLSVDELASNDNPLLPPTGLWARAAFLQGPTESMALGYFNVD
jgi:tetratricopeptide (TPR) repeat protein